MDLAALRAELRSDPASREHREVYADALLAAGDIRGELMAAQLAEQTVSPELFERCRAKVCAAVPGAEWLRIEAGCVSEIELPLAAVAEIDREWLASEPLLRVAFALPGDDEPLGPLLDAAAPLLRGCRGFEPSSAIAAKHWPLVRELIGTVAPEVLGLELSTREQVCPEQPWTSVRALNLVTNSQGAGELLLGASVPELRRLRLSGPQAAASLDQALQLPALEHLDLRGVELDEATLARLQARPSLTLRHERLDPSPPDLDDVFGQRGLIHDRKPPLLARIAAVPGKRTSFACVRGTELQLHVDDRPHWRRELDAPATAVAALAHTVIVGLANGRVEAHAIDGQSIETIVELPGPIHTIRARGKQLAIIHAGGWWKKGRKIEQGSEAPSDWVLLAKGEARALGTRVELRLGRARTQVELGEPISALASDDRQLLAIAGRQIWRIDPSGELPPRLLGSRTRRGRPALACKGELAGWTSSRTMANLLRGTMQSYVAYAGSYSHSETSELAIADLSAIDARTMVVALEHGGANLLVPGGAMKADEFAGEPRRRWIFVYEGQILMAG